MKFNGVEITQETIVRTRRYFADNCTLCAASAVEYDSIPKDQLQEGKFFVNDLAGYIADRQAVALDFIEGKNDNSFTFWQRAHWLQTGECVALFSKG